MRALLVTGSDPPDDVATLATRVAEGLRRLDVDAAVAIGLAPDLSSLDVLHLFGAEPAEPCFRQALRARGAGLPIVLTPVWRDPPPSDSLGRAVEDVLARRDGVMHLVTFALANALALSTQDELDQISSRFSAIPELTVFLAPSGHEASDASGVALAVYNVIMSDRERASSDSDWRAAFSSEEYIQHLESLIQLQLEAIALRDGQYASTVEYVQSLEVDRERREEYIRSLDEGAGDASAAGLAGRLRRLRP